MPAVPKSSRKKKRPLNIESIIAALDATPENYESAWYELKAHIMETYILATAQTLAPTSLRSIGEALKLFNLYEDKTFLFPDVPSLPVPQYLKDNIARIYAVTNGGSLKHNEAFSRTILDQIILCSIYEENSAADRLLMKAKDEGFSTSSHIQPSLPGTTIPEDPAGLELLHETPLSKLITHEGEKKLLTGFADYSIWYDSTEKKTIATNFLFVAAKRRYGTDTVLPQIAAYMGIIHTARKMGSEQNCVVYGAVSDGIDFRFCRIDDDGVFISGRSLSWEAGDGDKIYSMIRSLLRAAALLSPSRTPIRDPMRRKMVLASFGNPQRVQRFDHGMNESEGYEDEEDGDEDEADGDEDEENEEEYEVVNTL